MTFNEVLEIVKNVNDLLAPGDKEVLYKYSSQVPENGVIIDIGTAAGGSAFIMSLASKDSVKVYTMDPMLNPSVEENIDLFDLIGKLQYQVKTSEEVSKQFEDDTIDMIFVDGVHNWQGVRDDWNHWESKLKKGGIIAFHDVVMYGNTVGVSVQALIDESKIEKLELIESEYNDKGVTGLLVGRKL